jgi:hypothetical protein
VITTTALHKAGSLAVPNRVAVEGELCSEAFQMAGFETVDIVGAARVRALPPPPQNLKIGETLVLLVLLDLHYWHNLFKWSLDIVHQCSDVRLVIRPHPKQKEQVKKLFKDRFQLKNTLIDESLTLNDTIIHHCPHGVISGPTGSVIEFALSNWPCFLFVAQNEPLFSPLAWHCPDAQTVTEDWNSFKKIVSMMYSEKLTTYCQQMQVHAKKHIAAYGAAADQQLANLLFND